MAKLLIIVGLPGSGKSTLIETLRSSYPGVIAPDFHAESYDESSRVTDSKAYAPLVTDLRTGKDSIVADIEFCDTWRRLQLEEIIRSDVADVTICWHFFENAPEKCKNNARIRHRHCLSEELRKIDILSRKYFIPPGIEQQPVFAAS